MRLSESSSPGFLPAEQVKRSTAVYAELAQDEKTRKLIEARQIYEIDRREEREDARKEGRVEGRIEGEAIGEARGLEKASLLIAKSLLLAGDSPEKVSQVTGLDVETVKNLSV
ncbi:MAG: hypothetical protein FWG66_16415 [Spirochaetes bacterium]|nr:hypothetical protein [Spirochaetota bacterium]